MKDLSSGAFSVSYYIFSIIVTFSTSPMFIMNMEFKTFLIRKCGQLFIFNARTYFRSHGFPAQRNEPGRGGKNMKQKFGRRSKVHRTIVPQGYQQQETACNRNNCQVNNFKIRREEQGPRCNQITRPSLMIHVQEAEHSVQNMWFVKQKFTNSYNSMKYWSIIILWHISLYHKWNNQVLGILFHVLGIKYHVTCIMYHVSSIRHNVSGTIIKGV